MRNLCKILILVAVLCTATLSQSPSKLAQKCQSPNQAVYGVITFSAVGNITYTPCPTRSSIFYGNVNFSNATVTGLPFTASPLTTKGDLWGFSTVNARVPVGANDSVLVADSAQTLGVKYTATPTFSGLTVNSFVLTTAGFRSSSDAFVDTTTTGDIYLRPGFSPVVFVQASTLRTGFNTLTPRQDVDILHGTNPQLRLTQADNSVYTDLQTTGAGILNIVPTGGIVQINGTPVAKTIASGTSALATGAISSATCATAVTTTATGTLTTDAISWGFNGDPTAVTGYVPLTSGMLTIIAYPSAGNVNFRVCNNTTASVTPGAITLNWRVVR